MKSFLKNTLLLLFFVFLYGFTAEIPKLHTKYMADQMLKTNPELVRCIAERPYLDCVKLGGAALPNPIVFEERLTNQSLWIVWSTAVIRWFLIPLFGYLFVRINRPKRTVQTVSA